MKLQQRLVVMEEQMQQRSEQQQIQQLALPEQQQPQAPMLTVHTDSGLRLTGAEVTEDSEIPPEYTEL